ncbi:hypothetical protein GCM10022393_28830 [Aquimarina addita]|uniref:histidine kinase n=1 Tax=Aquimarina addita TaxID=870485 RepID=A0ABP6UQF2_9FLAO
MIFSRQKSTFKNNYSLDNYLKTELYELIQNDAKVFEFIQDSVLDGIWFWDLDHPENEWMSPKFWTTLGYDPNKMPHRSSAWQEIINQNDLKEAMVNFTKHCRDSTFEYDQIVRYTHKLGHTVWIQCRGLAIRDDFGKPLRMLGAHSDITKLKKAEENLKKQLDRYQHIIDGANLGTWEWNVRTGETIFNERWANIIGYSLLELNPVSFETWVNSAHPLDLVKSNKLLEDHFKGVTDYYECESRMRHKNGEWIWVLNKGKVVSWDADGTPEWVIGSHQEITKSKKALEKNRLFVAQAPSAIAMFDTQMRYLAASQRWLDDYKINDQNIIGKSHYEVFPEIGDNWKRDHQECLQGKILKKDEDSFEREDGSIQWISWELRPWYTSENIIGGILMHTADISKIKEVEAINQERKTFLEAILDSIDVGIVSCDKNGKLLLFNKATKEWHGLPPGPVPPEELSKYYGLYRTDGITPLSADEIPLLRALKGEIIENEELTIVTASGVKRKITTNGSQLKGANGEVFGAVVAMHDITRVKEAEALNQERQTFLEAILDNINVGIGSCDKDGNITLFNSTTKKWFGLPDDSVPTSEWSDYFGLYKEDAITPLENNEIPLLKSLNGEEVNEYEIVITTKNKEKRHIVTNASQLIGAQGDITGAVVAMHDITDRKNAEEQLRQSEQAFRGNFENAAIGMAIINLEGQWVEVNNSLCNIIGYTMEELKESSFQDITHAEDLDKDLEFLNELVEGKRSFYHLEKRYIHKNGYNVHVILSVSTVRDKDDNPLYFVSQITDISPRIKARKRLQQTLAKLEGILEASSQVAVIGTDTTGLITNFNTGAENLLGYKREELIFKENLQIMHVPEEIRVVEDELSNILQEKVKDFTVFTALADREKHFTREWSYVRKDGTQFPVQLTITAIKENDSIIGYLGVAANISEIKNVERELKSLLDVSKDQNKRLRNFAHIVSHNLKSHSGNFEMLLDLYIQENPEAINSEIIQLFQTASVNLSETIKHLNQVVLINNSINDNLVPINVREAINNIAKTVGGIALEAEVSIINNASADVNVMAIPAYLDSILLNFMTNGIKYRSEDRNSFVSFEIKQEDEFSVISIKDNGIGIDLKRHREKLFGMYKTFHNNAEARGIGLFITKNQIEALGGKVDVFSEVNKGTNFKIYLKNEEV